jgi:hypothetical protein
VTLIPLLGSRQVYGFNGLVNGKLDVDKKIPVGLSYGKTKIKSRKGAMAKRE